MIAQTFHMGIIEASFFINQEQIAEELCENKDKPELQCEGHCQLKKELEKKNEPQAQNRFNEMSVFIGAKGLEITRPEIKPQDFTVTFYNATYTNTFVSEIFHPPGLVVNA